MSKLFTQFTLFFFLLIISVSNAQTRAGKIFSSEEAEILFGKPDYSMQFNSSQLAEYLISSSHLLFCMTNEILIIANQRREILYPVGYRMNGTEIFHGYASSVINELLGKSAGDTILFQMRGEVFTVTYGNSTMEFGFVCPPYCIDD